MGLDQSAYAIAKHDVHLLDSQEYIDGDLAIESEEQLQVWRKHANLQEWMSQRYTGVNEFNCERLFLDLDDIEQLEQAVKSNNLPHGVGFFWGQSYPEDKIKDLEFIKKAKKALKKGLLVYYTCWY